MKAAHRLALGALVVMGCVPWLQLVAFARAAALRLSMLTLVLLTGCCAPAARPLFPPGPTLAAEVLEHGQVALAAARWQDGLEASQAVTLTGDEAVDRAKLLDAQIAVDLRWAHVAEAMRALRDAMASYQAAVDQGQRPSESAVLVALCGLRAAMPTRWRTLAPAAEGCP